MAYSFDPDMSKRYDDWLTTPPEDERTTKCKCCKCKEPLYLDDEYYELDEEIYCEDCAYKWLDGHKNWVCEWMAYGDSADEY